MVYMSWILYMSILRLHFRGDWIPTSMSSSRDEFTLYLWTLYLRCGEGGCMCKLDDERDGLVVLRGKGPGEGNSKKSYI